ncbi:Rhodanese-like domain-containing protein [Penicillium macrosclerotiorum]|uniref:Rhodanese-like domain-containing protein n=1 Tax=Penicillium macrosclerotiorum TaxID=303699 RepID=UPI002546D36E|nr:Rhodanese-like domain-containing protein [Penicillium macrosclerotiorum]KAJ5698949.1 Rhodanese-like domain-containing protein [Penicillium macrosclerotiorum]
MAPVLNPFTSLLISPAELHHELSSNQKDYRIIPVAAGRSPTLLSFESQHVPGSMLYASLEYITYQRKSFFNMDLIRDTRSEYPVMLADSTHFAKCMTDLGIRGDDILVIYDTCEIGIYSSPRVAWNFLHFGHQNVHVLNNFPQYIQSGYPISTGKMSPSLVYLGPGSYEIPKSINMNEIITFEELQHLLLSNEGRNKYQILDARPPNQFSGLDHGAYASLRAGHMPGALNIPLTSMLDANKVLLPTSELKKIFANAGVKGDLPAVMTCNSGVTASALILALHICGYDIETRLYDGSWMEWAIRAKDDGLIVTN